MFHILTFSAQFFNSKKKQIKIVLESLYLKCWTKTLVFSTKNIGGRENFLERPITIEFYKNPGILIIFAPISNNIIEREFYQKKITGLLLIFSFFSFFFGIIFIFIIFDESFSIISQKVIDQKMMISSLLVFYFSILLVWLLIHMLLMGVGKVTMKVSFQNKPRC